MLRNLMFKRTHWKHLSRGPKYCVCFSLAIRFCHCHCRSVKGFPFCLVSFFSFSKTYQSSLDSTERTLCCHTAASECGTFSNQCRRWARNNDRILEVWDLWSAPTITDTSLIYPPIIFASLVLSSTDSKRNVSRSLFSQCYDRVSTITNAPSLEDALKEYLESTVFVDEDLLKFWYKHREIYPMLANIERAILAIPISNTEV